jgi:hypothetical protein
LIYLFLFISYAGIRALQPPCDIRISIFKTNEINAIKRLLTSFTALYYPLNPIFIVSDGAANRVLLTIVKRTYAIRTPANAKAGYPVRGIEVNQG